MAVKRFLALGLVLAAGGCFSRSTDCEADHDCDGEGVCTRTGDCVAAGTAIAVAVEWTVGGAAPSEASCAPLAELEVVFYADQHEATSYAPVPCSLGRTNYDKMPPWLDQVELIAYDGDGRIVASGKADIAPTAGAAAVTVAIDLAP